MDRAALYLRSSKDRHDVSIDVQRSELQGLAARRSLIVVDEFADVVESGKDEDRPAFLRLIQSVRNPQRGWTTLLVLDTSRLARRRLLALLFEERECARAGVHIIYKTLPESMDPGMEVIVKSQLQAMDEWHSITSRQKGLAGMAQNVHAGFRAGGRPPHGYRLQRIPTGAVRDGLPVTKSRLEPDEHAPAVKAYLAARADGVARSVAASESGIDLAESTLVGVEWNALTYAGHTVWNVHAARHGGSAVGGHRRRPRADWQMQRDTHPALISDTQAEVILAALAAYSAKRPRRTNGKYLLTGLLRTPAGARYYGEGSADAYRVRGRYVQREPLEKAVMGKVVQDLAMPAFIGALVQAARASEARSERQQQAKALKDRIDSITDRISRMLDMAASLSTPAPVLRRVDQLEAERTAAVAALDLWRVSHAQYAALATVDAADVKRALAGLTTDLRDTERDQVKAALAAIVEKIELDPSSFACRIHYRIQATTADTDDWAGLASRTRGDATLTRHDPAAPCVRLVQALRLPEALVHRAVQSSGSQPRNSA